jgi:thioredoxin reductase (NADPH)
MIAGGLGSFEPRKPKIETLPQFEKKGVEYMVREPEAFLGKKLFISGGGDSALDWAVELSKIAKKIILVHRRDEFRAAQHTVDQMMKLKESGKIDLYTNCQPKDFIGSSSIEKIIIEDNQKEKKEIKVDSVLAFFGLKMELGPIVNWGLNLDKKTIVVNTHNFETNEKGIFAVGDICSYPGKLKLILCGFHEAALAAQECFKRAKPDEKYVFRFTTSSSDIHKRLGLK